MNRNKKILFCLIVVLISGCLFWLFYFKDSNQVVYDLAQQGSSDSKGKFIPEQHTDYIFTTVETEFSFWNKSIFLIVILLIVVVIWKKLIRKKSNTSSKNSVIKLNHVKLDIEDFIVSKDIDGSFCIRIIEEIKNVVLLNKNFANEDVWGDGDAYFIFSKKEPDNYLLKIVIEYIFWLAEIKDELIIFYNSENFSNKLPNVGDDWFNALSIFDFSISIDENYDFYTEITLLDHYQNDFGFHLEIINKDLKQIKYNPEL
ncbi:hypothetical protein [Flavobacterium sp.]|uniref:hypothetical protein n=1 Tax=Flavobacterium sp. TaxID=239 RepID=UPI0031D05BFB